jgi:hypothetical protein
MKPEDYKFRDYDNIERKSPILGIDHHGLKMSLNYDNTAIFSFSEPYAFLTHVYHVDAELGKMTFFDSDELLEQLRGYQFPEYREPLPSEKDVDEYFEWHSKVLAVELGRLALDGIVELDEVEDFELEDEDDEPDYGNWGWD